VLNFAFRLIGLWTCQTHIPQTLYASSCS
jgi:hypothetical protein